MLWNVKEEDVLSIFFKIAVIILGSIIAAYGITLAIGAGFGGATLAVLWEGVAYTFDITIGTASFAVALLMIAFALIYDKKQIYIGTIINQIFYSYFIDVFTQLHQYPENFYLQLCIMLLGIVLFAVGTGIYAFVDWGRGSYEAVTFAIVERKHFQIKTVRMALDAAVVIIGMLLGGQFGICTILTILLSGPIIQLTIKALKRCL
ncbi:YczE/YyaS/YitT family protein [Megamonas hypermegale]|uniref:YczE/YyaS/YitT family protein n=1 Tax=Megamonas hypermegale TaxID=158847 RepID=UPI0030B842DD